MSKPITEEQLEHYSQESYLLGQAVAYEDIAGMLRKKSGELFAQGSDEHAQLYRTLSREVGRIAEEKRCAQQALLRLAPK